jgi:hypothetical protein
MARKQAKPPKVLTGIAGIGGPVASAASLPVEHSRFNWPQIDAVLRFHIRCGHRDHMLNQGDFIAYIHDWCRQEKWKAPSKSALEKRIHKIKKQITTT